MSNESETTTTSEEPLRPTIFQRCTSLAGAPFGLLTKPFRRSGRPITDSSTEDETADTAISQNRPTTATGFATSQSPSTPFGSGNGSKKPDKHALRMQQQQQHKQQQQRSPSQPSGTSTGGILTNTPVGSPVTGHSAAEKSTNSTGSNIFDDGEPSSMTFSVKKYLKYGAAAALVAGIGYGGYVGYPYIVDKMGSHSTTVLPPDSGEDGEDFGNTADPFSERAANNGMTSANGWDVPNHSAGISTGTEDGDLWSIPLITGTDSSPPLPPLPSQPPVPDRWQSPVPAIPTPVTPTPVPSPLATHHSSPTQPEERLVPVRVAANPVHNTGPVIPPNPLPVPAAPKEEPLSAVRPSAPQFSQIATGAADQLPSDMQFSKQSPQQSRSTFTVPPPMVAEIGPRYGEPMVQPMAQVPAPVVSPPVTVTITEPPVPAMAVNLRTTAPNTATLAGGGNMMNPSNNGLYTVQVNETYWGIAEVVYGSGLYYKALAEYNRQKVPYPDQLSAGTAIELPPVERLRQLYPQKCPGIDMDGAPIRRGAQIYEGPRSSVR